MLLTRPDVYQRLLTARAFMDAHYDQPLVLEQVARQAGFSRYHFLRLFRRAFGCTPHQYLTRRRLAMARALLAAGELSVTEICFAIGFESVGSFSNLFRRQTGLAPLAFRARALAERHAARQIPQKLIPGCFMVMWNMADEADSC